MAMATSIWSRGLVRKEAGLVAKIRAESEGAVEGAPDRDGFADEFAFLVDLDNDGKAKRCCRSLASEGAARLV